MKIRVNDEERDVTAPTLAALVRDLGLEGAAIATAVNGDFAPVRLRATIVLREGDAIELLAPMRGG